jgi:hypothetical protein
MGRRRRAAAKRRARARRRTQTHAPRCQVGKTTLIKSLVKHYTRHNLASVKGPITVVSGKQRRLQLVECGPGLSDMVRPSRSRSARRGFRP